MTAVFIDTTNHLPYDYNLIEKQGLGGTEQTVLLVLEQLAKNTPASPIYLAQLCRTRPEMIKGVNFIPLADTVLIPGISSIVSIRKVENIARYLTQKHQASLFHLAQNFDETDAENIEALNKFNGVSVCVSDHLLDYNQKKGYKKLTRIYNAVSDHLSPDPKVVVDRNKLLFFSSPHKGLNYTLDCFKYIRKQGFDFQLFIANPGYMEQSWQVDSTFNLGSLSQSALRQHIQSSFAIFYPNTEFPETFGLVYAEAAALGTPVLAHDFGAAREIMHPNNPPIDCTDLPTICNTLYAWRDERPQVRSLARFKASYVAREWATLLGL